MEKTKKNMSISFNVCVMLTLDRTTTPDPFIAMVGSVNLGEGRLKLGKQKSTYTEIQKNYTRRVKKNHRSEFFKSQRQATCVKTMRFT